MAYYIILLALGLLFILCVVLFAIVFTVRREVVAVRSNGHHQAQNLRHEFLARINNLEKEAYESRQGNEVLLFNSDEIKDATSLQPQGARAWDYVAHRFAEGSGEGSLAVADNIITIHRNNTDGRFEFYPSPIYINQQKVETIPADASKTQRHLHLQFEVKKHNASHLLRAVFKGAESKEVLDEKDYVVFNTDWQKVDLYFTIATTEACSFRMDDLSVTDVPSSIQLRHILLYEKEVNQ